jgi:hypothetical protein
VPAVVLFFAVCAVVAGIPHDGYVLVAIMHRSDCIEVCGADNRGGGDSSSNQTALHVVIFGIVDVAEQCRCVVTAILCGLMQSCCVADDVSHKVGVCSSSSGVVAEILCSDGVHV